MMAVLEENWQEAGRNYHAFLLRCWQEVPDRGEPNASFVWRFTLVPINDESNTKGFVCLEDLFGYLHDRLIQARGQVTRPKSPRLEISTKREEIES